MKKKKMEAEKPDIRILVLNLVQLSGYLEDPDIRIRLCTQMQSYATAINFSTSKYYFEA